MQTRKPEIEQALLTQAGLEFYAYGFKGASVRRIIKASGSSIGNFYNYYENKEALFDALVRTEYLQFISFIKQHENEDNNPFFKELSIGKEWKSHLGEIFNKMLPDLVSKMLPDFNIRFVILIEGSEGTKYENARSRLTDLISEHFMEHAQEEGVELSPDFCEILAVQFINGFISIIKMHKDNMKQRNKLLTDFIIFYFSGAMGMLGLGK